MRWFGRAILILLAIVALLAPALWISRDVVPPRVVRWAVNYAAGTEVLDDLAFHVSDLSLHHVTVDAVRVNRNGALRADQARLEFEPRELLRGGLRTVVLTNAHLDISVGPDGTLGFGSLDPAIAAFSGGGATDGPPAVRRLELQDARIAMAGAVAGRLHVDGTVVPGADGTAASLNWRADVQTTEGVPLELAANGTGTVNHSADAARIVLAIADGGMKRGDLFVDGLRGTAAAELSDGALSEATVELAADRASAGSAALPSPYLHVRYDRSDVSAVARLGAEAAPEVTVAAVVDSTTISGRRSFRLDGSGDLARVDALAAAWTNTDPLGLQGAGHFEITGGAPADLADPAELWTRTVASGGITIDVTKGELPAPLAGTGRATVRLALALAAGRLAVETVEPVTVDATLSTAPPGPMGELLGAGPVALVFGSPAVPFRMLVETPFGVGRGGLEGPVKLSVAHGGTAGLVPRLTFHRTGDGWQIDRVIEATLQAAGFQLNGIRIERLDGRVDGVTLLPAGPDGAFELEVRASAPQRGISGAVVSARGGIVSDTEGIRVTLSEPGRLAVGEMTAAGIAPVKQLSARILAADRPVLNLPADGGPIDIRMPLSLPALVVESAEPGAWKIALEPMRAVVDGTIDREGRGGLRARLSGAAASVAPAGVMLEGLAADLRLALAAEGAELQRVDVRADRMVDQARLARFTPLSLEGSARGAGTAATPDRLAFRVTVRGADGAFVVDAEGHHAPAAGRGAAKLTLFPIRFVPGGLQPADLSPAAAALFRGASGEVSLAGHVRWPGEAVPPDDPLTLTLKDLGFTGSLGTVTGLEGALALSRIDPPMTPAGQVLSAKAIDLGIPMVAPRVRFRLEADGLLRLERVESGFAGGRVTAEDVAVPLGGDRPVPIVLAVERVDAARLAEAIDLDGLAATGTLSGWLPLIWDPTSGIAIQKARLTAGEGGGSLRYAPGEDAAALQDQGEQVSLLLKAIRNFVYESLEVEADGRPGEPFDVKLRLRGANPDLYDGYPIALNVTLTGALDQLFGNLRRSLGLTDVIRRKLEASGGG